MGLRRDMGGRPQKLSLVNPRTFAVFDILRTHPVGLALIAGEALGLLAPATGSYDPFRLHQSVQSANLATIAATLLMYLLVAGGLAGLFVRRRQWFHWMGLVAVPLLYVGGEHSASAFGVRTTPIRACLAATECTGSTPGPVVVRRLPRQVAPAVIWLFGLLSFGLSFYFTVVP